MLRVILIALTGFAMISRAAADYGPPRPCNNLNLNFIIDSSELDGLYEFQHMKEMLVQIVSNLSDFLTGVPMVDYRVSLMTYSSTIRYWHKDISLARERPYLEETIKYALPKIPDRPDLLLALEELAEYKEEQKKWPSYSTGYGNNPSPPPPPPLDIVIFVTKSMNFLENQTYGYESDLRDQIQQMQNQSFSFFLIRLDSTVVFKEFLYDEPPCAHLLSGDDGWNLRAGIQLFKDLTCDPNGVSSRSQSCTESCINSLPCTKTSFSENNIHYVIMVCDKSLLGNQSNGSIPITDFVEVSQNYSVNSVFSDVNTLQLTNFDSEEFDNGAFAILNDKLRFLILRENSLRRLRQHMFEMFKLLEYIGLASNKIDNITENTFSDLTRMQELDLQDNLLRRVEMHQFYGMTSLLSFNLNKNVISDIESGSFSSLISLRKLNLANNKLSRTLRGDEFNGLGNLTDLDLSFNSISYLPPNIFRGLGNLNVLKLSGNEIAEVSSECFPGLAHLDLLDLANNKINTIDSEAFVGLKSMKLIDLSGNRLNLKKLPQFDSENFHTLVYSSQNIAVDTEVLIDDFFSTRILNSDSVLELNLNNHLFLFQNTMQNLTILNHMPNLRLLKIKLFLGTFVNIIRQDICNLLYFSIKKQGWTLFILDSYLNDDTDERSIKDLRDDVKKNCELRLLMSRLNIGISKFVFPPFGIDCRHVYSVCL